MAKVNPGTEVEFEGEKYTVLKVFRGSRAACEYARQALGRYWRVYKGQWVVVRKLPVSTMPDYHLKD